MRYGIVARITRSIAVTYPWPFCPSYWPSTMLLRINEKITALSFLSYLISHQFGSTVYRSGDSIYRMDHLILSLEMSCFFLFLILSKSVKKNGIRVDVIAFFFFFTDGCAKDIYTKVIFIRGLFYGNLLKKLYKRFFSTWSVSLIRSLKFCNRHNLTR